MTSRRILSAAVMCGAFLSFGPAIAQLLPFDQGLRDGYNGNDVSPPTGASYNYSSGFLAGQAEAKDQDDEVLRQQHGTERNLLDWQRQMNDRTTSLGPDPMPVEGVRQPSTQLELSPLTLPVPPHTLTPP
jgi:hypothetical protein